MIPLRARPGRNRPGRAFFLQVPDLQRDEAQASFAKLTTTIRFWFFCLTPPAMEGVCGQPVDSDVVLEGNWGGYRGDARAAPLLCRDDLRESES